MKALNEKIADFKDVLALPRAQKNIVRTTFNLSQKGHDAIGEIADTLNKKNAEVFEAMMEIFNKIGNDLPFSSTDAENKTRKTYVIDKKTLSAINKASEKSKIPRDTLIDNLAQTVKIIIERLSSEKDKKYTDVLKKIINPFWIEAEKIEKTLIKELGDDDPVVNRFGLIIVIIMNLSGAIENYLNNGEPIDPEDLSQQD
jgi:archaellum component FlaC